MNKSFVMEGIDKARDAAVANLKNFGFEPDDRGLTCTKDGKTYDICVHAMPFKDKCVIVDYEMLTRGNRNWGIVFMNKLTDYQDKVYVITNRRTFKEWVDENLGKVKFMWNSKPNEAKLYRGNMNFFGVTIEVSELKKQPFCEVITK